MPANSRVSRVLLFSVLLVLIFIALASGQASQKAGKSTPSVETSAAREPSPDASKYVGAETCKTCHEEIYNAWEKTPHWKTTLNKEGGPSKQGCEGCHGPGADHVAGGGDVTKIFTFKNASGQGNQRPLHELPRRRPAAHERDQLDTHAKQRQLHLLPFAAPRANQRVSVDEGTTRALLLLPSAAEGPVRNAVSPSRK